MIDKASCPQAKQLRKMFEVCEDNRMTNAKEKKMKAEIFFKQIYLTIVLGYFLKVLASKYI